MPDQKGYTPNLLESALNEFQTQWTNAIEQSEELASTHERLVEAQLRLAEFGTRTSVTMPTTLAQTWWVAFRRHRRGEAPEESGGIPLMPLEDEIVRDRLELVDDTFEMSEGRGS